MGQITWQGHYGGIGDELLTACIEEANGDMLFVAGLNYASIGGDISDSLVRGLADMWLIKVDTTGNKIIDKRIGGAGHDAAYNIQKTSDGGYLIGSHSNSNQCFEKSENSKGGYDFWLIKLDSALNIQWDKTIGGPDDEWSPTVIFLNDSTFLLCGESNSDIGGDKGIVLFDTTTGGYKKADMWVSKWMITTPAGIEENNSAASFTLYPNPANDFVYVRPQTNATKEISDIVVRDISGRMLMKQTIQRNSSSHRMSIEQLSKGIYFLEYHGKMRRFVKI
jgi:hypothetical protein